MHRKINSHLNVDGASQNLEVLALGSPTKSNLSVAYQIIDTTGTGRSPDGVETVLDLEFYDIHTPWLPLSKPEEISWNEFLTQLFSGWSMSGGMCLYLLSNGIIKLRTVGLSIDEAEGLLLRIADMVAAQGGRQSQLDRIVGILEKLVIAEQIDAPSLGELSALGVPVSKFFAKRVGVTEAALLAVVLDRQRCLQAGPLRSRETALAITKLEEALHWMRAADEAQMAPNFDSESKGGASNANS